ncbi:hypothetical protein QQP08_005737 [Theobroma cacao]|nr:hypothetical protein QQP08_005737 [Theobroma cacao]
MGMADSTRERTSNFPNANSSRERDGTSHYCTEFSTRRPAGRRMMEANYDNRSKSTDANHFSPPARRRRRWPFPWREKIFNASAHEVPSGPNPISNSVFQTHLTHQNQSFDDDDDDEILVMILAKCPCAYSSPVWNLASFNQFWERD